MHDLRIAEQLAAVDLVVFRTRCDPAGCELNVVAPYHPVVLTLFAQYSGAYTASDPEAQAHRKFTVSPPLAESCD